MAANDELPRGLLQNASSPSGPSGVSITFPASPGISWVLTDVELQCFSGNTSPGNYRISISTNLVNGPEGEVSLFNNSNEVNGEYSWSGQCAGPIGVAVTITVSSVGGVGSYLVASAYPA